MGRRSRVKNKKLIQHAVMVGELAEKQLETLETKCGQFSAEGKTRCPDDAVWEIDLHSGQVIRACDFHAKLVRERKVEKRRRLISKGYLESQSGPST